ncbi:MAG: NADH-quinone oxidoreductase subunit I [Pseudomonadota bacterium]
MILPILRGLGETLRRMFDPRVTIQYPEQRRKVAERFRGRPQLVLNDEGRARCVACTLCQTVCPPRAIKIEPAEGPQHQKYPARFTIDLARCIFCGFCQEACPKGAIKVSDLYELAEYERSSLVYDKERLKAK